MLVTFMDMFFRLVKRSYKSVTLPIHMQVLEGVMEKIYVVEEWKKLLNYQVIVITYTTLASASFYQLHVGGLYDDIAFWLDT
jgi:hypothetical protein